MVAEIKAQKELQVQKMTVRHMLVVATGILICFAPSALVFNTWSLFMVPVTQELGVTSAQFAVMPTIIYLGAAIFSPFAGNLMEKYDLRLIMSLAVGACAAGLILSAFYTDIWMFYLSGLLEGFGVVILICLGPGTLINRWFAKNIGLFIGICVAMSGLGGAVWSMADGLILSNFDYHAAYLFNGFACLVLGLPATLFFIRSYPAQVGLRPYGDDPSQKKDDEGNGMEWGVSAKLAFGMPALFVLALMIGLVNGTAAGTGNLLPTYLYHLSEVGAAGLTAATVVIMASVIASCMQISQMLAKVYLGAIADKSIMAAMTLSCGATIVGILLIWQGYQISEMSVYIGGFLYGLFYGTTNVLGPTITRYIFGQREYTKIFSRVTIVVNIFPAIFVTLFAFISEISWDLLFGVSLGAVVLVFILALILVRLAKNVEQTLEPRPE